MCVCELQEDVDVSSSRGSAELNSASPGVSASPDHSAIAASQIGSESSRSSSKGSVAATSIEGVEAHILGRIAAVCQPGIHLKARNAEVQCHADALSSFQGCRLLSMSALAQMLSTMFANGVYACWSPRQMYACSDS